MKSATVKITSKGQVTLPKAVREALNADTVYFEIVDDQVIVRPVRSAAGMLREYAGNYTGQRPFNELRDEAWEQAVREKYGSDPA